MTQAPCPCGSGNSYSQCCERLHDGIPAETAEQLMRSRFSAFALGHQNPPFYASYLQATHVGASEDEIDSLMQSFNQQTWLSLYVLASARGLASDNEGMVEFTAFFRSPDGDVQQLHEKSRFVRDAGHWRYLDGQFLPAYKVPRNAACWCGSGKKHKHCHG